MSGKGLVGDERLRDDGARAGARWSGLVLFLTLCVSRSLGLGDGCCTAVTLQPLQYNDATNLHHRSNCVSVIACILQHEHSHRGT